MTYSVRKVVFWLLGAMMLYPPGVPRLNFTPTPTDHTTKVYSEECGNKTLPDLPDYRYYHTVDYVDGQVDYNIIISKSSVFPLVQVFLCGGEFVTGPPEAHCFSLTSDLGWAPHSNLTTDRFSQVRSGLPRKQTI